MRDLVMLDVAQHFPCIELGHDDVGGADSGHGEGDYSGRMGKRRSIQAN